MCIRLTFGKYNQLNFSTPTAYYEALGFLASSKRTSIHWENNDNQGAWGKEGRIHCLSELNIFPPEFQLLFSAGNSNILKRINCNDYINHIRTNHNFILGKCQNINLIRSTIPINYLCDFDRGVNI